MKPRTLAAALIAWTSAAPAFACTICHSPEALGVRHQVFEHGFLANAAALAAPVPLLVAAILLIGREPRGAATP